MRGATDVCIVGLGPWGLCSLERLVDAARQAPDVSLTVHVVEPRRPGGGLYAAAEPDYFVLNTPCGQHSMYPFPERHEPGRLGKAFYEWVSEKGYRWDSLNCHVSATGDSIGPHDFLPRRLMGEYLEWFYEVLVAEAPPNLTVLHHETSAIDIEPSDGGRERVCLENGGSVLADHVAITTGHMRGSTSTTAWPKVTEPYPSESYVGSAKPSDRVAIEGMGLVALDVVTALTTGLGGSYLAAADGSLTYCPSGREPSLYMYSRTGYPYCAKSFGAADPMGDYRPGICTMEAVAALKGGPGGAKRQMDARRELLPLVFAEMELCYYTRAAELSGGHRDATAVREGLLRSFEDGSFEQERERCASTYGRFDAREHFFVGDNKAYLDDQDYEAQVYRTVHDDVEAALVPGGGSPLKAAYETLRALRDTLRFAVEFKGLTLESHLDFQSNLRGRFARLVAGPPAIRCQQLLALMDAGVLSLPFGPAPEVVYGPCGTATVRSTHLGRPFQLEVDLVIRAHLDSPSLTGTSAPLVRNLLRRGRLRPLTFGDTPAGGVDLDEEFHPLDTHGKPAKSLWLFGVLSEGARYFTLYIPSPKSRSRAFIDAAVLAQRALSGNNLRVSRAQQWSLAGPGTSAKATLKVGLVNNMPDGAFVETESRFSELLSVLRSSELDVVVSLYTLPGIRRGPAVRSLIEESYLGLDELRDCAPDALVVTGAEPTVVDLHEEPFWSSLEQLLAWARREVPSMMASCMSAHAALLCFDGVNRRLRLQKCSGVYRHMVDVTDPLMVGVGELVLPHSRFNEVASEELESAGYKVLANSDEAGWAVAVGQRGRCELLLLQGHPEYTPLTLLREYRRDVRRYLSDAQGSYPHLPDGYFDDKAVAALAEFEVLATMQPRDPEVLERFPFDLASRHVTPTWEDEARALVGNWLRQAHDRARTNRHLSVSSERPSSAASSAPSRQVAG